MSAIQSKLLKAAKKRWPKAILEYRQNGATARQRDEARDGYRFMVNQIKTIETEYAKLKDDDTRLVEAARFVVDVNGDPPSIDELRTAVEATERRRELWELREELIRDRGKYRACVHSYRYFVLEPDGIFNHACLSGDSWSDLFHKLRLLD